jgi:hypothetical protein
MARQDRPPDQWVIVDDGAAPLSFELEKTAWMPKPDKAARFRPLERYCGIEDVRIVRRAPCRSDPPHTLPVNLLTALDHVAHGRVAFFEDDDWYSSAHIGIVDRRLAAQDLFGFQGIIYYHVGRRSYQSMGAHSAHSSLCQTGITAAVFPTLRRICSMPVPGGFVDLRLWAEFFGRTMLLPNLGTVVGIKGQPGRVGLTAGWRYAAGYTPDPQLAFLKSLIGADVENYR